MNRKTDWKQPTRPGGRKPNPPEAQRRIVQSFVLIGTYNQIEALARESGRSMSETAAGLIESGLGFSEKLTKIIVEAQIKPETEEVKNNGENKDS